MFGSRKTLSAVTTAILISIGVLIAWYTLCIPAAQYFANRQARGIIYERVAILEDGTPLISISKPGGIAEYRDLNGDAVAAGYSPVQPHAGLTSVQPLIPALSEPSALAVNLPSRNVRLGWFWPQRIMGLSDRPYSGNRPVVLWYFIRGNRRSAYLLGYDSRTRERVGFIGTNGYQAAQPEGDQRFELSPGFGMSQLATRQFAYFGRVSQGYVWHQNPRPDSLEILYLALRDKIVSIDLRRRKVSTFVEIANVLAVAVEPTRTQDEASGLIVRTPETITVVNRDGQTETKYPLPTEIQTEELTVHMCVDGQIVIDAVRNGAQHNLFWVDPQGSITRREAFQLNGGRDPLGEGSAAMALIAPGPLAMSTAYLTGVAQLRQTTSMTLGEANGLVTARLALPAAFYIVLSGFLAVWILRRERAEGNNGIGWAVFVFLLGIPGLIGYLFQGPSPPRTACGQCKKTVARNRPDCSSCGEPFTLPPRTGVEIFA